MVRVYLAEIKEYGENQGMPKEREKRENNPGRRQERQSAAAHCLLFKALEKEFPGQAGTFCLEKDERGKPYLSGHEEIYISISHSGGLAACAVADSPVGVDLEERKERPGQARILRKFHVGEREWLEVQPEKEQTEAFYDLWVRKESFLKAAGEGLRLRLDSFCTAGSRPGERQNLYDGRAALVAQTLYPETYYIRQYALDGGEYSLAACSQEKDFAGGPVWISLEDKF